MKAQNEKANLISDDTLEEIDGGAIEVDDTQLYPSERGEDPDGHYPLARIF